MSQILPVNGLEWVENVSKFNEDFIKKYDENSNTGYFLEVDVEYLKKLLKIYHFYHKEKKLINAKSLFVL